MDIVQWLREVASEHNMYRCDEAADEIERLRWENANMEKLWGKSEGTWMEIRDKQDAEIERLQKGFVWLDDTIEGHLLFNPENKDSKLIQEIKRKISFILSNGGE